MGSSSSSPADATFEHEQHAPMWVVSVKDVLEMTGTFQAHQVLKAEDLLEIWSPKMFTFFVSHQWLAVDHPDPDGVQLVVLQGLLSNLMTRKLKIENDLISQWNGHLTEREPDEIKSGYIWLDYCCVPQLPDGCEVPEQLLYVYSIPSYVHLCNVFLALVPQAIHQKTHSACNVHSWLQRGWCRTELWCHFLSGRSKTPIVVVKSHDQAQFTAPLWHRHPVHSGDFVKESDREVCRAVLEKALLRYVSELRAKNHTAFRLYLSLFEEMSGLPGQRRNVEDFLAEFSFSKPLEKHKGLGPMACAALCGDPQLIRELAAAKASLETHAPGMPETMNQPDFTPLHLALWFRSHDLPVLETLLSLRADPNSSTAKLSPPLGLCRNSQAVELLIHHGAGVNFQGQARLKFCPLHSAAGVGAPVEVLAKFLELKADVNGGRGGAARASPLHFVAFWGDAPNDLRSAQLLLEARADIDQVFQPEGLVKRIELICRAYSLLVNFSASKTCKQSSNW